MRRGLLAAAAGAVIALLITPGAHAQLGQPTTAAINITSPKTNDVFGGPGTTSGAIHAEGTGGANILWVKAALAWNKEGAPPAPMPPARSICGVAPGADPNPSPETCTGGGADVAFNGAPLPVPAFNGPFRLVITAHVQPGFGDAADITNNSVTFGVAVSPATPANFKASTNNKNRLVTLGWDRNSEPDLWGYGVYRLPPGQTKPPSEATFRVLQSDPGDGNRVTVIDDAVPAQGGQYTYVIQAARPGATGDFSSSFTISGQTSVKATVGPGTPGATPTTAGPKGGGAPVIKGGGANAPRLSSASPSITNTGSPTTTEATVPDPGFTRNLPYTGSTIPGEDDDNSENSSVAINQAAGKSKSNQRGVLIPAATGAILFVAAFQLRWLKNRLEEPVTPLQ